MILAISFCDAGLIVVGMGVVCVALAFVTIKSFDQRRPGRALAAIASLVAIALLLFFIPKESVKVASCGGPSTKVATLVGL